MRELRGRYCYKAKLEELYEKYLGKKTADFPDLDGPVSLQWQSQPNTLSLD